MKKRLKRESHSGESDLGPYIAGLIVKMQQQLSFLEKKLDILIGQCSAKPAQHFDRPHHQQEPRQENNYRERTLHKAICADCNKECEVPFRPSGGRPVYCKDCFAKRKRPSQFKTSHDNRPQAQAAPAQERRFDKERGSEGRKFSRKRPVSKKRKARK